jgi:hypothetical protein
MPLYKVTGKNSGQPYGYFRGDYDDVCLYIRDNLNGIIITIEQIPEIDIITVPDKMERLRKELLQKKEKLGDAKKTVSQLEQDIRLLEDNIYKLTPMSKEMALYYKTRAESEFQ